MMRRSVYDRASTPTAVDFSGSLALANFTLGNGTIDLAEYRYTVGGMFINVGVTFGSTTAITGALSLTYPDSFSTSGYPLVSGDAYDSTATDYFPLGGRPGTSTAFGIICNSAPTGSGNVTATTPFTWAMSDTLRLAVFVPKN